MSIESDSDYIPCAFDDCNERSGKNGKCTYPWCRSETAKDPDPNDYERVFGSNLFATLSYLGMSQSELAKKCGLTQGAISQIVNGEREPSLRSICKILRVIPVKFERLMEGK